MPIPILTTERCILRPPHVLDAERIWEVGHMPGFTDGMTWEPPQSMNEPRAFIESCLKAAEAGEHFNWMIESQDGAFIGNVGIKRDKHLEGNAWGLGYWIHPAQQGKGYATEAARAAVGFAFEQCGADIIVTSHMHWNHASGKVMQKIGLRYTGQTVGRTMKRGQPVTAEEYEITRAEWEAMQS